jgi:hypothetical protein
MSKMVRILLVFLIGAASAAQADERYQLSIFGADPETARRDCALLHNALTLARKAPVESRCANAPTAADLEAARASGNYRYHLRREREAGGSVLLTVENWEPRDDTDFERLSWRVEPGEPEARKAAEQKLVENFVEYDTRQRLVRETLLVRGAETSTRVTVDAATGRYVDRATGAVLNFDAAWDAYRNETPRQRHFLKAGIEVAAFLGVGAIWYWSAEETNSVDWDYHFNWESFRKKLVTFDGVRFDNNTMHLNSPGHPLAGAIYYLAGRGNGFSALESFLWAVAGSTLWEYLVEFREVVSINDMIFTPVGGAVIGEVMHQLGRFFARGSDSLPHQVLAGVFGNVGRFNDWWNKNRPRSVSSTDRFGFSNDVWHKFSLFAQAGFNTANGGAAQARYGVGFDTQLITVPGFGRPGQARRFLTDTTFTQLTLQSALGPEGMTDFLFFVKAAWAGYYRQDLARTESGDLQGYSFLIGPATAYEHRWHQSAQGFMDQRGVVNVLGPSMELHVYLRGVKIRCTIDVFGDFAAVRSYTVDRYVEDHVLGSTKSILADHRYYFAFGVTMHPQLSVSYRGFEAGAELRFDSFHSIQGKDRRQELVKDDFSLQDRRLEYRLWLAYTLPGDYLKLQLSFSQLTRSGEMKDLVVTDTDRTVMGSLIFVF